MTERIREFEDRTRFEPAEVEPRIVERWLSSGLFHPEPDGEASANYSIAIPPPNAAVVVERERLEHLRAELQAL